MGENRAKIFLSSGQRPGERDVALAIAKVLEEKGFYVYMAIYEQASQGFVENIFQHIESSEYFIFVDFRRELISCRTDGNEITKIYRGSLFSSQELALALYLKKPLIAFQEKGIKPQDGLLAFAQVNPIIFSDRNNLPLNISEEVDRKIPAWDANWKSRLVFEVNDPAWDDIMQQERDEHGRFIDEHLHHRIFHIGVRNLHKNQPAINCVVTLENAKDMSSDENITFLDKPEIKWAGIPDLSVMILPDTKRYFDACLFYPSDPPWLDFYLATGYGNVIDRFVKLFRGRNNLELTYSVKSQNFPPVFQKVNLNWGNSLDSIVFELID